MKKILAKDLQGKEFEIELAQENWEPIKEKHRPDKTIASFLSFGLGSRLRFEEIPEEDNVIIDYADVYISKGDAVVTSLMDDGKRVIIKAEKLLDDGKKEEILNKIIKKIDFDNALNDEIFIAMLSNVFTEEQLKHFLVQDDIEILLFDGLMYLKSGDKAYRL